jgi:hypothetical protein
MRLAYGVNAAQGVQETPSVQYWRGRRGDVDYVFEVGDTPVPVALAYRSSDRPDAIDGLAAFTRNYDTPVQFLVSSQTSRETAAVAEPEPGLVELPYWLYLLLC